MKGRSLRLAAMLLIVCMLLSGCGAFSLGEFLNDLYTSVQMGLMPSFGEMEYYTPDVDLFRDSLASTMEMAKTETNVRLLMDAVMDLYYQYYDFVTNYNLANIHYCQDMTDIYWDEQYSFCLNASTEISAGMDQLLYALADSPLRKELEADSFFGPGFFDAYEGESLWDETFTALMEEESALVDRYYDLNAQAVDVPYYSEEFFQGYGFQIEEVFLELVQVRQEIAAYAGYESFPAFAYEFYFYRDYSPQQAAGYIDQIRQELVPLYTTLDPSVWNAMYLECTEEETREYVRNTAESLGGTAKNAFALMDGAGLYDIAPSDKKYDASFEVYLFNYNAPFVFVNPSGGLRDKLTFVHEFGHFCSDYAAGGSMVGIDVAEIFSQGLEYLSLCRIGGMPALEQLKMADSLSVFVEQAAYADFELEVYALEGAELTVENVREVYRQSLEDFGITTYSRDERDYVLIPHFFISPQYVISYVVSNDVAMQIYQLELEGAGNGAKVWEDNLATMQPGVLGFVEEAGLQSPFTDGRVAQLRAIFEKILPKKDVQE